jgi:hypothetical protein
MKLADSTRLNRAPRCHAKSKRSGLPCKRLMVVSAPQTRHVTLHGIGFSYKAARDFWGSKFRANSIRSTPNSGHLPLYFFAESKTLQRVNVLAIIATASNEQRAAPPRAPCIRQTR